MMPSFNDKEFWDAELQRYADLDACVPLDAGENWRYFMYCLQTQNRFFFQNPLVPVIINRFEKHAFILASNTMMYRARIDTNRELVNQCWLAKDLQDIQASELTEEEKQNESLAKAIKEFYRSQSESILSNPDYQKFLERKALGFEGFDAEGSGAAPYEKTQAGRCNPEHVSFLYAADTVHTAVAEVRPYIRDAISVATLVPRHDLKLVDFYFEYDEHGAIMIDDAFYHQMRADFTIVNKGNKEDYLITQYLTLLAQNNGFDGIRFRSSLVRDGANYVLFSNSSCEVRSSKMYIIPEVKYFVCPILDN